MTTKAEKRHKDTVAALGRDWIVINISGAEMLIDKEDALAFVGVSLFVGSNGYAKANAKHYGAERYVHRIVMNAGPDDYVDHINGDKLDNRRRNLRLCTQSENMRNARMRKDNRTGFVGVRWDKQRQRWAAQISACNKMIPLGRFDTLEEAIEARRAAEEKYHGDFAARKGVLCGDQG